jgi:hypothetical protein
MKKGESNGCMQKTVFTAGRKALPALPRREETEGRLEK